jgi:hypothetical protein
VYALLQPYYLCLSETDASERRMRLTTNLVPNLPLISHLIFSLLSEAFDLKVRSLRPRTLVA